MTHTHTNATQDWMYEFSDTVQDLVLVLLFLWRSQSASPNQHWLESQNANLESYASVHVKCFPVWEYRQPTVTHNELITNTHTHTLTHTSHAHSHVSFLKGALSALI